MLSRAIIAIFSVEKHCLHSIGVVAPDSQNGFTPNGVLADCAMSRRQFEYAICHEIWGFKLFRIEDDQTSWLSVFVLEGDVDGTIDVFISWLM